MRDRTVKVQIPPGAPDDTRMTFADRYKFFIWRYVLTPFLFPLRVYLKIFHMQPERWTLGHLAPGRTAVELRAHLLAQGWEERFLSWLDQGEVVNLRLRSSFEMQHHLRIYRDGEVRGHYECTPEAHPYRHQAEIGMEPRREEFFKMLEGWIIQDENLEK